MQSTFGNTECFLPMKNARALRVKCDNNMKIGLGSVGLVLGLWVITFL